MHEQYERRLVDRDQRRQVLQEVVRQCGLERRLARDDVGVDQDRVAIGRRPHDEVRSDRSGGARLVLDDDGLAQDLGRPRGQRSRRWIDSSARSIRNDEFDGAIREGTGLRETLRADRKPGERQDTGQTECFCRHNALLAGFVSVCNARSDSHTMQRANKLALRIRQIDRNRMEEPCASEIELERSDQGAATVWFNRLALFRPTRQFLL
jgi:hypothetical protein